MLSLSSGSGQDSEPSPSPNPDQENVGQEVNANGKNGKNGRNRKDRTIGRRTLLGAAAGAAALTLITRDAPGLSADADRGVGAIPGTIERIVLPKTIHARNSNGSVIITMKDAAHFRRYRAGTDVLLADYMIGDEIVAEGHWRGDVFVADALVSCYRLIVGRITSKDGSALHTISGTVYLTPDTKVIPKSLDMHATIADLTVGDDVRISTWRDPSSGNLVAAVIGWQGEEGEA